MKLLSHVDISRPCSGLAFRDRRHVHNDTVISVIIIIIIIWLLHSVGEWLIWRHLKHASSPLASPVLDPSHHLVSGSTQGLTPFHSVVTHRASPRASSVYLPPLAPGLFCLWMSQCGWHTVDQLITPLSSWKGRESNSWLGSPLLGGGYKREMKPSSPSWTDRPEVHFV